MQRHFIRTVHFDGRIKKKCVLIFRYSNELVKEVMVVSFQTHARWLVKCKDSMESIEPLELIALSRVASQVKKYVLLAVVAPDTITPYYIEYCWWKPQRVDL